MLSKTLRLELQPFGVKVVTVMAGAIQSNFFTNQDELQLPQDSDYRPIQDCISDLTNIPTGKQMDDRHSRELHLLTEITIKDGMLSSGRGLDELAKSIKSEQSGE